MARSIPFSLTKKVCSKVTNKKLDPGIYQGNNSCKVTHSSIFAGQARPKDIWESNFDKVAIREHVSDESYIYLYREKEVLTFDPVTHVEIQNITLATKFIYNLYS
jgi:hypothetical protein